MLSHDEVLSFKSMQSITSAQIQWFRGKGVTPDALAHPELPVISTAVFNGDGTFDFSHDDEAHRVIVFMARDEQGKPLDLVAWAPQIARLAAWYNSAPLLGMEQLYAPRLDREQGLPVYETPLQWLIGGRDGVVIINSARAAVILCRADPLKVGSYEFGRRLGNLVNPKPPRILVPSAAIQRASA